MSSARASTWLRHHGGAIALTSDACVRGDRRARRRSERHDRPRLLETLGRELVSPAARSSPTRLRRPSPCSLMNKTVACSRGRTVSQALALRTRIVLATAPGRRATRRSSSAGSTSPRPGRFDFAPCSCRGARRRSLCSRRCRRSYAGGVRATRPIGAGADLVVFQFSIATDSRGVALVERGTPAARSRVRKRAV